MQYLLTQEEMNQHRNLQSDLSKMPGGNLGALVARLDTVRKRMVLEMGLPWRDNDPYGCLHIKDSGFYGYCDKCPAQEICMLSKEYSK